MYIPEFVQSAYHGTRAQLGVASETVINRVRLLPSVKKLLLTFTITTAALEETGSLAGQISSLQAVHKTASATLEEPAIDYQARCLAFQPLNYVSNATLRVQEYVTAGTVITEANHEPDCLTDASQTVSVDLCRIAMNITTSPSSGIVFEAWFPDQYDGRLFTAGTSGMGGCIRYVDIDFGVQHGFATVASNNGHEGNRASVFYNHSEVLQDFVWRALHVTTETGKALVPEFYPESFNRSYFSGCSGAGRQGIKAAEMWPNDYDGIIVGAPGENFNNMVSWVLSFYLKTGDASSPDFISADIWTGLIHNEILRQCDGLDGVWDGIIEDPNVCDFRPEELICEGNNTANCLSARQVRIVRSIFSPLYGSKGEPVFPAMQPGSEPMAVNKLYTGVPYDYAIDWYKYVVYSDLNYTTSDFSISSMEFAIALDPYNISTSPSDLSPFTAAPHNGKMIMWHGGADQEITSFESERFYNQLMAGMNLTSQSMDEYIRFFRIPGVFHCRAGPGAWMIGQETGGTTTYDPEHSILSALVHWVEDGVAPDTLTGTKYIDDDTNKGVERQRRHCRYPYRSTYLGEGRDGNLKDSWVCKYPGEDIVVGSELP